MTISKFISDDNAIGQIRRLAWELMTKGEIVNITNPERGVTYKEAEKIAERILLFAHVLTADHIDCPLCEANIPFGLTDAKVLWEFSNLVERFMINALANCKVLDDEVSIEQLLDTIKEFKIR